VIFYDGRKVVALRREDGKPLWASQPVKAALPVHTSTGPRTLIHKDVVLFAGNDGRMTALSAADGKQLWHAPHHPSGHQSLRDLLVIDDWGLVSVTETERRDLLEVVEDRDGTRSTIMTSQLPVEKWHDHLGNPSVADAICDRLLHRAHRIVLQGPSRRKEEAQKT